eukprot:1381770-Amorphochlora_amoeboformis.AAC.2
MLLCVSCLNLSQKLNVPDSFCSSLGPQPTPSSLQPTPTMFTGIPSLLDDISNRPTHQPSPRTPRKKKEEPEGNEVEISIATIIPFVFLGAVLGMWFWCYLRRRKREREIEALGDFLRAQIKEWGVRVYTLVSTQNRQQTTTRRNNKREGANPASTIATNMPLLS